MAIKEITNYVDDPNKNENITNGAVVTVNDTSTGREENTTNQLLEKKDAMVILKDIAAQNNATMGWDATTKAVTVNDKSYTPEQLTAMGGKLVGGRWTLPSQIANGLVGGQTTAEVVPAVNPLQGIIDSITGANKGYLDMQVAEAGSNRDAQIAELEATLSKAIQDGQMSVLEAKEAFETQKKAIEQAAYTDAEQSQVQMQNMGVQNSQQAMGMMASDQSRKQSLVNDNIKNRDNRVLQINERIKGLTSDANIQKNKINADYDTNILRAQGESAYNTSNAIAGVQQEDYFTNKAQDFEKWMQEDSQSFTSDENDEQRDFTTSEREDSQEFQSEESKTQREWQSTEANLERDHAVKMQGNEFVHDKQMTAINFKNNLTAMSKQAGYNLELEDKRSKNSIAEYESKLDSEYSMILKEKSNELIAANNKYNNKNSLEYKAEVGRINADTKQQLDSIMNETLAGTMIDLKLNKPGAFDQANVDEIIGSMGGWDKFWNMDNITQGIYDKTVSAIDSGKTMDALIKSLSGYAKDDKIRQIVEPMYENKEWNQVYEELMKMMEGGLVTR